MYLMYASIAIHVHIDQVGKVKNIIDALVYIASLFSCMSFIPILVAR